MQLDEKDREAISKYGQMLSVCLRIVESSAQVNIDSFKEYCKNTYMHLIDTLPWVSITPTLHKLLGHSWELISLNEGVGLKRLDESGMEGCNKMLRTIRTKHSQKISQQACNIDCLTRLWLGSDPVLQQQRIIFNSFGGAGAFVIGTGRTDFVLFSTPSLAVKVPHSPHSSQW